MKKLVKNGMLCTESGVYEADLLIEDDVIREIGTGLADEEAEVVDASGRYVLPGAVDIHMGWSETPLFLGRMEPSRTLSGI